MLAIGATVLVRTLKRHGVVVDVLKAGVYRVQLGAVTITAREGELDAPPAKKKPRKTTAPAVVERSSAPGDSAFVPASIDLHGLTVDEARNRLAGYISRAILAGHPSVEVIHGIGTGRVKAAVTKDLHALSAVRAVKPHPRNPGITVVFL